LVFREPPTGRFAFTSKGAVEAKLTDCKHLTTIGLGGKNAEEKLIKKPLTQIAGFHNLSRQSSGLKI
jgi:hypothetical protein